MGGSSRDGQINPHRVFRVFRNKTAPLLGAVFCQWYAGHMKLVSWNVNGIRAVIRKGEFEPMLRALKPDILCLQETKAEQGQAEIDLPDFEEYWNSAEKKGYSGTAIFTTHKPRAVLLDFPPDIVSAYNLEDGYGNLNGEGRVITLEYDNFFLVNVYTPNSKGDLSRLPMRHEHWDPAFLTYLTTLEKKKPVMCCGDLNAAHTDVDLARPKDNEKSAGYTPEERAGVSALVGAGYVDAFRLFHKGNGHYTWWSNFGNARERNVGWRIDYWFVSEKLQDTIAACDIHADLMGSDHCPVSLDVSF